MQSGSLVQSSIVVIRGAKQQVVHCTSAFALSIQPAVFSQFSNNLRMLIQPFYQLIINILVHV